MIIADRRGTASQSSKVDHQAVLHPLQLANHKNARTPIFDVSLILNVHQEALYLRPTLFSLSDSAERAREAGISVELVTVFDRSDAATKRVFFGTALHGFASVITLDVDVGSLGLARNAGIAKASGEFVWTADADDLVSSNALTQLVTCASRNHNCVYHVEYYVGFGQDANYIAKYENSSFLTAADFALTHPYGSRIFAKKAVLELSRYRDLKPASGFACEDWDLNCRLFAQGFNFETAPRTVIFYRHRSGSLMRLSEAVSEKTIPHLTCP